MCIYEDPDEWITEVELGGMVYKRRRASTEEKIKNRTERLNKKRQELQQEIDYIDYCLKNPVAEYGYGRNTKQRTFNFN